MDLDEARAFVAEHKRVVMATLRADGTPQLSPVTATVDDEGYIVVSTRETAMKTKNLRRDPRVWLAVLRADFYPPWLQLAGRATVVALPEAMDGLIDYYRKAAGEHPDWDDYRAAMERDKRVLVRIEITQSGATKEG